MPLPEAVPDAVARIKNSVDAALWERGQELFAAKFEAQRKRGLLEKLPTIPGAGHVNTGRLKDSGCVVDEFRSAATHDCQQLIAVFPGGQGSAHGADHPHPGEQRKRRNGDELKLAN